MSVNGDRRLIMEWCFGWVSGCRRGSTRGSVDYVVIMFSAEESAHQLFSRVRMLLCCRDIGKT